MITEDMNLVNAIFSIIDNGIVDGYESFRYEVVLGPGFIDTELLVEKDGMETTNARTDLDDTRLYELVEQLQQRAQQRGEHWTSLTISYRQAGQVTAQFHYADQSTEA